MAGKSILVRLDTVTSSTSNSKEKEKPTLKFGIGTKLRDDGKGELVYLEEDQPLSVAILKVCESWGFTDPTQYALKFNEFPCHYVTEERKKELSGKLVTMDYSSKVLCKEIIQNLEEQSLIEKGLETLTKNSTDPTFINEFIKNEGLKSLFELLDKDKIMDKEKPFNLALQALLDIMHQADTTWDKIKPSLVSRLVGYINTHKGNPNERLALKNVLQVLENCIIYGNSYEQIDKDVTLPNLIFHIQNHDSKVQQNVLSLVNALLMKADYMKRKYIVATILSKKFRDIICYEAIKKSGERSSEINHEMYVMQTHLLNLLEERKNTIVDQQDQETLNKIKDLCRIAFDSEIGAFSSSGYDINTTGKKEKQNFSKEYKKLGFEDDINPALDFSKIPPGILALDCMRYLAENQTEIYTKLVLESAYRGSSVDDDCPFAKASIYVVAVLCDILKIGEPPTEQQGKFHPFFFHHEKPFEELYVICAQLVNKTWKEMRAQREDFGKVFDIVKEQIKRALDLMPESFESFQKNLNALNFSEIANIRQQERNSREEAELQAKPIQDLRKKLEPEIFNLIKQNRMNFLIAGTRFPKYSSKGKEKGKFWFCRLSPNGKVFHYGDCEEKATPLPEELPNKVSFVENLLIGKDCPHMKDGKSKKTNPNFCFSLVTEKDSGQTLDFVSPTEKTFDLWTDGVNAILGKPMISYEAKKDLDLLLRMELKLRLLDIDCIPDNDQPPIPPPPANYDFSSFLTA